MSTATVVQSDLIANEQLQKRVERTTVEVLKLSIVQGLNATMKDPRVYQFRPSQLKFGDRIALEYPSAALVVAHRLKGFKPEQVDAVRLALGRDSSITSAIRGYGIDMRSQTSVVKQLDLKKQFSFVNEANFGEPSVRAYIADVTLPGDVQYAPIREALMSDLQVIEMRTEHCCPQVGQALWFQSWVREEIQSQRIRG